MRKFSKITDDMEKLILEMTEDHELQWGEILNIIRGYLEIHCPESQEYYADGTNPIFYYGHQDNINKNIKETS